MRPLISTDVSLTRGRKLLAFGKNAYQHKVFRYLISGGFSAAVDISTFIVAYNLLFHKQDVHFFGMVFNGYSAALVISYTCGSVSSFLANKFFVFSTRTSGWRQLVKSLPVYLLAFAGNYVLLKFFVEYVHWWPTISRVLAALLVAFVTFNLHKYFTFKEKSDLA